MESVIFIESNTSGTGEIFIKKALEYNFKPVFLTINSGLYSFLDKISNLEIVELDTLDEWQIIDFCEKYIKNENVISGITSSSEYYIEIAAKIAAYFKLPGADSDAISNCRNKYSQYKTLYESGVQLPKTKVIENTEDIVTQLLDMNFPVIVKPIEGTGSVGVRLCNNYTECYDLVGQLLLCEKNERGIEIDHRVLVEEYIQGEEYSGEVFDGELIGITKKHLSKLPYFVETGHDFPAVLEEELYTMIDNEITKAVKALRLGWGACHVEFRILDGKVFFIEVNPRLAGGFIPEIVKKSTGIDLIDNQLRRALNMPINLKKINNSYIGIRFIIPSKEGYLISFSDKINRDGIVEIREYKSPGTWFVKKGDFRDRVGHVVFDINTIATSEVESMIKHLVLLEEDI